MRFPFCLAFFLCSVTAFGQIDVHRPFSRCGLEGSTAIYDLKNKTWLITDSTDARTDMLPASTFKVINLLIALETGAIKDENDVVKWVGTTDTTRYGYRPEIYRDMTVREAFEVSAGWVFIELARRVGRAKYRRYLERCRYGNRNLSEPGVDFWNFGALGISPVSQVEFLVNVYEEKLPFSKRNLAILKKVMITEKTDQYTLRSKTGWTRPNGRDIGWWVGYVERPDNVYFFATRVVKPRSQPHPNFGACRKEITRDLLRQLHALP